MDFGNDGQENDQDTVFWQGVQLYRQDRSLEALAIFSQLLQIRPNSVGILAFLGAIHQDLGHLDQAIKYSERATQLSPVSELSSLILYHSLREAGYRRKAYGEMQRFLTTPRAKAVLYQELLADLAHSMDVNVTEFTTQSELFDAVLQQLEAAGELEDTI
jgi:tetratricopeptide (TPR) repeat protein